MSRVKAQDYFPGRCWHVHMLSGASLQRDFHRWCCVAVLLAQAVSAPAQIKYGKAAEGAEEKKTLLLRDFKPTPLLHIPVHNVLRARFPVIDMHNYVNDAAGIHGDRVPVNKVIATMDHCNVRKIVILTGMWGEKLQKVIDEMVKPYPDRFVVFTQVDWSKIDDPDFGGLNARQIDDAVRRGARGLKVLKDLGLEDRDKTGKLITVDDPRLDPVWEECGRLGIPVALHVTDPEAFFHPIDANNERYEELIERPDWSFYGHGFPTKESILEAQSRLFARHPDTTFIANYMANWPENLDYVSSLLDRCPNVVVDFGARQAELGRQPRQTRKLFLEHPDRILFGSGYPPSDEAMYRNFFRWLETADEYFDYAGPQSQGRWKIYALDLPDEVLAKVYHLNAEKIFERFKGIPAGRN